MDIRIIGGGFAGIVAGLQVLAHDEDNRHQVTVYERGPEIGTTLCGEGLSAVTLGRMRFEGFDHGAYVGSSFDGAAWSIADGKRIVVPDHCFTMDRARWIPAMADRLVELGGRIETERTMSKADIGSLPGDVVVGADGPGSTVRKIVGGRMVTRLGIQYRIVDTDIATDRLLFHTDKRFSPEYSWVFPRGDDPEHGRMDNVGLLAMEDRSDWERLDRFMEHWKVGGRVVRKEAYPIAFAGDRFARGRYVLIGDAAGLTNPVTKGGMAAAVYASEILRDCVDAGDVAAYDEKIRRHPIADPAFSRALDIIKATSNAEMIRWARHLPEEVIVGERSAGVSWSMVFKTAFGNVARWRDLSTLYRAMALSRVYSW